MNLEILLAVKWNIYLQNRRNKINYGMIFGICLNKKFWKKTMMDWKEAAKEHSVCYSEMGREWNKVDGNKL